MSHTFRFLAEPISGPYWAITDDGERHHCRKVLKLSVGATVEVTDGHGRGARGSLCPAPDLPPPAANTIWFAADDSWQSPEPEVAVHMLLGAIKPSDWDQVLPPLAEIGVAGIQVFACGGSAKFRIDDKIKTKAQKILLGAIKQSKRDYLPELNIWPSLSRAVEHVSRAASEGQRFVLAADDAAAIDTIAPPATGETIVVVGDEAGLSSEALEYLAGQGFKTVSFGSAIYRAKTAAICGAYFFRQR